MKQQKNMRSGSRPSPKGTRLLFAGGTVSPMMRPADGQQKDDKIVQTEDKPRLGQRQSRKKQRVDRNEVVDLRWISICLVFRGDSVWYRMINRDISWCHIPYHAISQDTIYRDIVSMSRIFGTDIEISYPVEVFLDTQLVFAQLGAPSFVHQESKRNGYFGGRTSEAMIFVGIYIYIYICTPVWRYAIGRLGCCASK